MAKQEENTMIEEREELMVPSNGGKTPKLKTALFLKPTFNPINQTLPKHPYQNLSSKLNIKEFKKKVTFKGRPIPQDIWHLWVGNMQQTHEITWKKVGIFDAIRASTYCLMRDNELIIGLAEKWCSETNTFVFPWGECSITLEDVMILGGFCVLGDCVKTPFHDREIEEIENKLVSFFPENRKRNQGLIAGYDWMNYFMDIGGELEHMAFIVLWLSRFVFSTGFYCFISPHVFPIAISLARGTKIALAPAVLASIYRDFRLLKGKIVEFVNGRDDNVGKLVVWAPFQLVQLWAWERFPTLCPEPICLFRGEPRLARWQNLKKVKNKLSLIGFESLGESFLWRPYAVFVENWELPEFYDDEERLVVLDSEVGDELVSFAKCLVPCELVGVDCTEQYLPQRVGMQFGLDQDIPCSIPRLKDTIELAWSTYDVSLHGVKLYISSRLHRGDVTAQYLDWSRTPFSLDNSSVLVFKRRRSLRTSSGGGRFKLSKNLDLVLADCSKRAPLASYSAHNVEEMVVDNCEETSSFMIPYEVTNTGSHALDGRVEHNNNRKAIPSCLPSSCSIRAPSSFLLNEEEVHIDTTTCDKRASPSRSYVENSERKSSQCPKKVKIDLSKNTYGTAEQNNLHSDVEMLTENTTYGFIDSVRERLIEIMPASEKNNSLNKGLPDNNEIIVSQSLEIMIKQAVSGMDLLMEQVGRCRVKCLNINGNRSFNNGIAEVNIERHDECYQSAPSQSTKKVADEVSNSMSSLMEIMKKHTKIDHADTNCTETGISKKHAQVVRSQDESLTAAYEDVCKETANDEQSKATKHVDVKLVTGSSGDPVIIDDDEEDNKENGYFNPFEVLGPKLDARISKLERVVSRMKAANLVSKGK